MSLRRSSFLARLVAFLAIGWHVLGPTIAAARVVVSGERVIEICTSVDAHQRVVIDRDGNVVDAEPDAAGHGSHCVDCCCGASGFAAPPTHATPAASTVTHVGPTPLSQPRAAMPAPSGGAGPRAPPLSS